MSYSDTKTWFGQRLIQHKDNSYNSNGSLEVSHSISANEQLTFFDPVFLNISIQNNNARRACSVSFSEALELFTSIKKASVNGFAGDTIERNFYNRKLLITLTTISGVGDQVAVFSIIYNDSDFGKVIVPRLIFESFGYLVKDFIANYSNIMYSLMNKSLMFKVLEASNETSKSIKTLPSMLINMTIDGDLKIGREQVLHLANEDLGAAPPKPNVTSDFGSFVDSTLDSISIAEIETMEKQLEQGTINQQVKVDINSNLFNNVLKNDLSNIESLFNSLSVHENPVAKFIEIISSEGINYLPCNDDVNISKSLYYIPKILYMKNFNSHVYNSEAIPGGVPIIKYYVNPEMITNDNVELSYDLLTIACYMKALRDKLESVMADSRANRAITYIQFRLFTNALMYSFIEHIEPSIIKSCVISRFKYFSEKGVFTKYNSVLAQSNFPEISEFEFGGVLENMTAKNSKVYIQTLHSQLYDRTDIALPFENKLSIEQILNELVPLEISKRFNFDFDDTAISADVLKIVDKSSSRKPKEDKPKKPGKITELEQVGTSLSRFLNANKDDVPEKIREEVIDYTKRLRTDLFDCKVYDLTQFADLALKAIYVWNESKDRKEKYSDFVAAIEQTILERDFILNRLQPDELISAKPDNTMNLADLISDLG